MPYLHISATGCGCNGSPIPDLYCWTFSHSVPLYFWTSVLFLKRRWQNKTHLGPVITSNVCISMSQYYMYSCSVFLSVFGLWVKCKEKPGTGRCQEASESGVWGPSNTKSDRLDSMSALLNTFVLYICICTFFPYFHSHFQQILYQRRKIYCDLAFEKTGFRATIPTCTCIEASLHQPIGSDILEHHHTTNQTGWYINLGSWLAECHCAASMTC
jgi:hypothetical protein